MGRRGVIEKLGRLRSHTGFPEVVATLLTVFIFIVSYWFESRDAHSDVLFRGIFLLGAVGLCGIVAYGVLYRHYVPLVSHLIVGGSVLIGLSQLVGLLEVIPALRGMPFIGRDSATYLAHADDMLLYPGFVLMLCGFYLSILHATDMHRQLLAEGGEKEEALRKSHELAETLAQRVAFENLATSISSRFINVDQDAIDPEIQRSLEAVGRFTHVDRVHFVVSQVELESQSETYEWCAPEVPSLLPELRRCSQKDFAWILGVLDAGKPVVVPDLAALPAEADFERGWAKQQGVGAFVRVPIVSRGRLRGYIGLDHEGAVEAWGDEAVPLLRMIGEILLSAWDRRCVLQQRALLELQVQQAQKMESLGVMAGGIAHDFNNILTGIMGNAELAQLGLPEDDERHKYMGGIIQSGRRAAELCRQMLAYSGRGKFFNEAFCINKLVTEMTPLLRATVSRSQAFNCELSDGALEIEGDKAQFRQVLVNLVTNASEALEGHPGQVSIRTGIRECSEEFLLQAHLPEPLPAGQYVCLEVFDSGCGMGDEVLDRIFDPFFTTRFAGRGLGLPAVLGIVRSHRGAIAVKTTPGEGTRVSLYIPARDTVAKTFFAKGEVFGDWHGHGTILLADDEEMVLSVGTMMLKHVGLDVVTAEDGDAALQRALEHRDRLQCIILDMTMPGMDGDATCARFKEQLPAIPLVISSGYMREDLEAKFAPGRISAYLSKPFDLDDVQSVMRQLLEPAAK